MKEGKQLSQRQQTIIFNVIDRGGTIEIKRRIDGSIVIYEVKKNKAC